MQSSKKTVRFNLKTPAQSTRSESKIEIDEFEEFDHRSRILFPNFFKNKSHIEINVIARALSIDKKSNSEDKLIKQKACQLANLYMNRVGSQNCALISDIYDFLNRHKKPMPLKPTVEQVEAKIYDSNSRISQISQMLETAPTKKMRIDQKS